MRNKIFVWIMVFMFTFSSLFGNVVGTVSWAGAGVNVSGVMRLYDTAGAETPSDTNPIYYCPTSIPESVSFYEKVKVNKKFWYKIIDDVDDANDRWIYPDDVWEDQPTNSLVLEYFRNVYSTVGDFDSVIEATSSFERL